MPTMDPEEFFAARQGAAVMKHAVLGRYLHLFASKVGKWSANHEVVYVDGYAGPGVYGDGNAGSPMLAAQVEGLVNSIGQGRRLRCYFIEADETQYEKLVQNIKPQLPDAVFLHGEIEQHLDRIIREAAGLPMLALIDPFGLGLTWAELSRLAERREPTDLLLNVSLSGVRRNAGHLTSSKDYAARETFVRKLDRVLGGAWWQELWSERRDAEEICERYCARCAGLRGGSMWEAVRDRWNGPPAYFFMLMCGHPDGLWHFNEFMSIAHEELRASDPNTGTLLELFDPQEQWIGQIESNVHQLVGSGPFCSKEKVGEIYGSTLASAREKHYRKALVRLHEAGLIADSPRGVKNLAGFVVRPN